MTGCFVPSQQMQSCIGTAFYGVTIRYSTAQYRFGIEMTPCFRASDFPKSSASHLSAPRPVPRFALAHQNTLAALHRGSLFALGDILNDSYVFSLSFAIVSSSFSYVASSFDKSITFISPR